MKWYLLRDGAADGATNMAKDDYLFREAARWGRPVLRLYEWAPETVSVGRNQKLSIGRNQKVAVGQNQRTAGGLDWAACTRAGVPVVRRMTGGWAVLHGGDLTYTVVGPVSGAFGDTIMATYGAIAQAFLRLFTDLGFLPTLQPYSGRERVALASPICFAVPSAYELLIDGRKLVGSAQRRRPEAFLQHGSIPIQTQANRLARLFPERTAADRTATEGADTGGLPNLAGMTDLESLGLWPGLSLERLSDRLLEAFGTALGAEFEPLPWTAADEAKVAELRERYLPLEPPAVAGISDIPGTSSQERSVTSQHS